MAQFYITLSESLLTAVIPIIKEVGNFIKNHFAGIAPDEVIEKGTNSLVSYVDKTAEQMLIDGLAPLIENVGFITEEAMTQQEIREYTWIIDPLDGTTNFLYEVPVFSISVALYYKKDIVLGIVHDVMHSETYTAIKGKGAQCNGIPIRVTQRSSFQDILVGTGFSYKPECIRNAHFLALREVLLQTRGIRRLGSAALDLCYVANGRFGALYEDNLNAWDIAAGALIVREAGGLISDYKDSDNWLFEGEILACAPQFKHEMLKITGQIV